MVSSPNGSASQRRQARAEPDVVISMTAVRRAARALKRINSEQVLMWESFWRASRFPDDHPHGARTGSQPDRQLAAR